MTGTALAPPAGWYPDPANVAAQRWWDGVGWTTQTRSVVQQPAAAAPAPLPLPPQPLPPLSLPSQASVASPASFGSLEWRDRAAAGMSATSAYAPAVRADRGLPNHEASRALFSGGMLIVLLVVDFVLQLPMYVRIGGVVVAIVLGLVGLYRWRTTGTGLKRSVAGLSIGVVMGLLAIVGATLLPQLQQAVAYSTNLEQAIVDMSNSVEMPALAIDASCPEHPAVPPVGTVLECILSLDDGSRYDVTVTVSSADGTSTILIHSPAG